MSNFLCGKILFNKAQDERARADLGFAITKTALSLEMGIQLGCNIVQPIISEILNDDVGKYDPISLAFFVTDSPITKKKKGSSLDSGQFFKRKYLWLGLCV